MIAERYCQEAYQNALGSEDDTGMNQACQDCQPTDSQVHADLCCLGFNGPSLHWG